ncbi:MAG: hypothetical protein ABEJ70_09005 [Halobacteriaceae archaeon]
MRRIPIAVVLSVLLLVAGCAGTTGDSGDGAVPTGTTSPDATSGGAGGGDGGAGGDDGLLLGDRQVEALRSAGSFTVTEHFTITNESGAQFGFGQDGSVLQVDLENDASYAESRMAVPGSSGENSVEQLVYTGPDGVSLVRSETRMGDQVVTSYRAYDPGEFGFDAEAFEWQGTAFQFDLRDYAPDGYREAGTDTVDGVPVTRYEADRSERDPRSGESVDATVSFAVDGDGLVREYDVTAHLTTEDGEGTMHYGYTVTDVGSTTVTEPDWLSEARAQAGR